MQTLKALVMATAAVWASDARADGVFDLARKPSERVWVTVEDRMPSAEVRGEPAMLARVHGVLGMLSGAQVQELVACGEVNGKVKDRPEGSRRVCVVHIDGPAGARSIRVQQGLDGTYVAGAMAAGSADDSVADGGWWRLRGERVDRLLGELGGYTGPISVADNEAPAPAAGVAEVGKPYQVGQYTLDARTVAERIGASEYIRFDAPSRVLQKEQMWARVPVGYSSRRPAGLVVWIDPGPSGKPPPPLFKELDELGMVCIGAAGAGNDRGVTDRLQLALDGVATARRRWNIDAARVYVVGVSGGGKMSSIIAPCFADVFAGAIPIVGLSTFEKMRFAEGKAWPAEYARPRGKRWEEAKRVRMAAITGSKDFNHDHVLTGTAALLKAGLQVRMVDVPGMGHEWPSPDEVGKQLAWIDEPGREAMEERERAAMAAVEKAGKAASRVELLTVVKQWPWTRGAWDAIGRIEKMAAGK